MCRMSMFLQTLTMAPQNAAMILVPSVFGDGFRPQAVLPPTSMETDRSPAGDRVPFEAIFGQR